MWEPKVAVVALCSSYEARHEAPHPSHECGLYAYADRERAEAAFAGLARRNSAPGVSWAFGRVSLWGRVAECEFGWRAQFAYPYDVTVFTDGRAPAGVAEQYAIDVAHEPLAALGKLLRRHPPKGPVSNDPKVFDPGWYQKSFAGMTDRWFLRPYHEETTRKLAQLAASVRRLERLASNEGRDDA